MRSVNDPHDNRGQFEKELNRLEKLPHAGDARAIRVWANRMTVAYSTRKVRVSHVRKLSERAVIGGHPPLTEMTGAGQFYELHDTLRDGSNPDVKEGGLSDGSLRTLRQAARVFFRDGLGREWGEEITIGKPIKTKVTEDDIFVASEVEALFSAAKNPRDKALMGLLLATGQRISAALSLRLRDVDLDGRTGTIYLNDEALGLKGAAGKRPLLWATPYLVNWNDIHPHAGIPDAALFCQLKKQGETQNESGDPTAPVSIPAVNVQFQRIAENSGVTKPVNPHNFRHSAITRMVRDGVPEQQVKWMVGWKPDSSQFERYVHLKDDEMLSSVLEHYDIAEPENDIGRPSLETCPGCGAALDGWVNPVACPGCGLALSHRSVDVEAAAEAGRSNLFSAVVAEGADMDADELAAHETIEKLLTEHPDMVAAKLAEVMSETEAEGRRGVEN